MALPTVTSAPATAGALALLLVLTLAATGCGEPAPADPSTQKNDLPPPSKVGEYTLDEGSWGKFHSKRFQVTIPLPDGKAWKIDDHRGASLVATHAPTSSRLEVMATQELDLMNRQRCEERARNFGWVPSQTLTTLEEQVYVGPEAYDSRIWVAIDAAKPGGGVEGHVYMFSAFLRRCLFVHLTTSVPSAQQEATLASRLAIATTRMIKGLSVDPLRTTDDANVPKDKPDIHR